MREAVGNFPLAAIGGITIENFHETFDAGADTLAVINDLLFEADRIENKMKLFRELSATRKKLFAKVKK